MHKVTGKTTVETLLGESLGPNSKYGPVIDVEYEADAFDSPQEAKDAGEWPNDKDVLDGLNDARERSALASARNAKTKTIVDKITSTVEYRRLQWIADTKKAMPNTPQDVIEAMAAQIV